MSEPIHATPLHAYVHARFREVFGQPNNSLEKDDHWAVQTQILDKPINILLNGTPASPAVWIFDPHSAKNPVYSAAMTDEPHVDRVIQLIQERVKTADGSASAKENK